MPNARRIAPVAALAVLTALTLSACGASAVTTEGGGLSVTVEKTGEVAIPAEFLESYPTKGSACVLDITIENTSDDFIEILSTSISSESMGTVGIGNLEEMPGYGSFYDVLDDRDGLESGEQLVFTDSAACIATDATMDVVAPGGGTIVEVPLGL